MKGSEIRQKFLSYFESKKHSQVLSSALIPQNDPTLFFTNAGMVQFKDVFTGRETRDYSRATTSQKCMRVSGKHNDLENVGRTPRHHTFFEMLGNFSFGDYFKSEAIAFAWDFLTNVVGIPKDYLWITIFRDDDEAGELWHKEQGVPRDRIVKCDEKDNFWSMGETGPCGPCSEIHVDLKKLHGDGVAKGDPSNSEDFMEIWNLVFMQFDRSPDGKLTPLPKPSIDTGMGLERLATVLQKKKTNFDTDLFLPIIETASQFTGKKYGVDPEVDVSLRVLADHIRASSFLINDGILPSNEGRGYVLRRIMRRAIRHGRMLGMKQAFFFELLNPLIEIMKEAYPDLEKNKAFVLKVLKTEEQNFLETLDVGLNMIDAALKDLAKTGGNVLDGKIAFKLYDTFGFPLDLTQLILDEKGITVDVEAFDAEMQAQKTRARAAWKGSGEAKIADLYHKLKEEGLVTQFVGYEKLEATSKVVAILSDGARQSELANGQEGEVICSLTPFYGESGGQVGDQGIIKSGTAQGIISDTQKPLDGLFVHSVKIVKGSLKVGDEVVLTVSKNYRDPVMINHTATHIMNAALREILGDHIKQAGSLVLADKLRFDFTHFESIPQDIIEKIEGRVNEVIRANYPVAKEEMDLESAKKKGALAFFGDKYGARVRVVTIGPYSMEFCGGTHLNASGEIGAFKIISESSVASGVRRIEAVTGTAALAEFQRLKRFEVEVASKFKASPEDVPARIVKLNDRIRELEKEITKLKTQAASGAGGGEDYLTKVKEIKGVKVLAFETAIDDPKALRDFSDTVKNRLGSGIAVIGAKSEGRVSLIVTVSKDLTDKYSAGKIVAQLAAIVGGKGGGRPDMAQAGGSDVSKLGEALAMVADLI